MIESSPPPTDIVRTRGLENGLMIYSRGTARGQYGDWIMATPPLIITEAECDELVIRLEQTLAAATADLQRVGALR
jgi:adenosylmethionine-8-amino-7-oxononanoate aminotransferase